MKAANTGPTPPTQAGGGIGVILAGVSVLGFGALCFLGGAMTMHAGGQKARPFEQAFRGATQWMKPPPAAGPLPGGRAALAFRGKGPASGLTLVTTNEAAEATLFGPSGAAAHVWRMPDVSSWGDVPGLRLPKADEPLHWERCHAYPNGDLLALCCAGSRSPYGFALAKFDKGSRLLWARAGKFHHDFDVAEDGRIYALTHEQADLPAGFARLTGPYLADVLLVLSPDGRVEKEIPLLQAFEGTAYRETLLSGDFTTPDLATPISAFDPDKGFPIHAPDAPIPPHDPHGPFIPHRPPQGAPGTPAVLDVLHTNGVRVLSRETPRLPLFQAGRVMLSMRTPSLIALLDLDKKAVVWAARGPWKHQHDAQPLADGRILLFDNLGASAGGARVMEYDPATQAIPWSHGGTKEQPLVGESRGRCQRLPNGNTLYVAPAHRVAETTPGGEIVWSLTYPAAAVTAQRHITGAIRYRREDLPFLAAPSTR